MNDENPLESLGTVTVLLRRSSEGDNDAFEELLPRVYDELRALAQHIMLKERPGHTLQATALVNEAYVRLAGSDRGDFNDRRHLFNTMAMVMRRVLVDSGVRRTRQKRGGGAGRIGTEGLEQLEIPATSVFNLEEFEALDNALNKLAEHQPRWAEVVQLRLFAGLGVDAVVAARRRRPAAWTLSAAAHGGGNATGAAHRR